MVRGKKFTNRWDGEISVKILYSKGDHDLLFNLNLASVVMRFVVDVFPFKSQKTKFVGLAGLESTNTCSSNYGQPSFVA